RQDHGMRLGADILDTAVATFAMKDEKDNSEVAGVCARVRQLAAGFGGVVVPIHHYGIAVEAGLRGASAWHAAADIVLGVLADVDPLSGEVERRELAITKSRDGITGPIAPFTLNFTTLGMTAHGQEFGSCHVAPNLQGTSHFGKAKKKGPSRAATALHDAITEVLDTSGTEIIPRSGMARVRAAMAETVREEFQKRYVA